MKTATKQFLSVLLADDDADDRMLFEDAVSEIHLNVDLQMVGDGEELMRYLLTSAVILPEIVFLDLNMPRKNGFQCLEEIRNNKMLRDIFVIIYSTTARQKEVDEVFIKGANLFIKKPNSYTELKSILAQVFEINLRECFTAFREKKFLFNPS